MTSLQHIEANRRNALKSTGPRTENGKQQSRRNALKHGSTAIGSAEPSGPWRRPMSISVFWTKTMIELPEIREGGMSGRNEQRKPGTTHGSPRRSRTAMR